MKKIIYLINPKDGWAWKAGDRPPLGLAYLSSYLKQAGHTTKIIDLNHTTLDITEKPDFICFTVPTPNYLQVIDYVKKLRELCPSAYYIAGGNHVASYPTEQLTLDTFDYVVAGQGEGEIALLDIIENRVKDKIVYTKYTDNLDIFPYPDYEGLDMEKYGMLVNGQKAITISSGRGCVFGCVYCGSSTIKKVRVHTPQYVINHMKLLYDKYNIRGFYFVDDIFTFNFQRTKEICNLIKQTFTKKNIALRITTRANLLTQEICYDLKEAGVDIISIGLESGSPKVLKAMKKMETIEQQEQGIEYCYNAKIKVKGFFIIGLPEETWEDIIMTINFAEKLVKNNRLHYADCYILNPIPASIFWQNPDQFDVKPIYPINSNWNDFYQIGKDGNYKINIKHPHLTNEQLIEGLRLFKERTKIGGLTYV